MVAATRRARARLAGGGDELEHVSPAAEGDLMARCPTSASSPPVSNTGRWGPDDQRGTLNLVDAAAVLRRRRRPGQGLSLAIPFDEDGPQTAPSPADNPGAPCWRSTPPTATRPLLRQRRRRDDGRAGRTHWDALAHVSYEGASTTASRVDGRRARRFPPGHRALRPAGDRGIVADVARAHGVDHFDDGHAITADDLDAAAPWRA